MASADRTRQVPVVIVGAGPAGLVSAVTLARNGIASLLVERNPGLSPLPRATAVSTRTMELLRSWGLEAEVRAGQLDITAVGAWTAETLVSPEGVLAPLGHPDLEQAAAASPTMLAGVPQDHWEPVLLRHLATFGLAEVRFGTELVALDQDADGVTVELRQRATGERRTVRAGYVIAADGAHSPTRGLLGIAMDGPDHLNEQLTVLFEAPLGEVVGERRYGIYFIRHQEAGGVFVPNGSGDRWLYGRGWEPEHERLEDYTDARLTGLIRTAAGVADLPVGVVAKGSFSFAAQVAGRYREGRAFLVGDAAQRMTPRGGMGMNTAVAEAHDLGWKLAWVLRGWAGPDLLDTYEAEWRPVGARRAARSADPGPEASGPEALAEDLNGRLPHAWLPQSNGDRRSTLDLLGPGLTLLTGPDSRPWTAATATLDTAYPLDLHPLDHRTAATLGLDPDGALLARPDAQVITHWPTAPTDPPSELAEATSGWFGQRPTAGDQGRRPSYPPAGERTEASRAGARVGQRDDDRQTSFIVEELAMAALDADLDEPGPLQRLDDLPAREDRELGHAGMRTSTDASSGFTSTSGTGCPRSRARALP
jgi:putative polyketide hydroxylase